MASLSTGVRRVYNHFYKRKATGSDSYIPTPAQIKEYFNSKGFDFETIDNEQFNQAVDHFSKSELSLATQQESVASSLSQDGGDKIPESSLVLTDQQLQGIVSTKAVEMSLQLSTSDVEYVANQIDNVDTTLEDVLAQTENLLCAYADHKKQESIQKIDAMFGRVYSHVQHGNEEASSHISSGLQRFGRDVEQSQQDFKSSVLSTLDRLRISSNSA